MLPPSNSVRNRSTPLIYGTAWKEEQTAGFVSTALKTGFRGIDTANQRKHYHEAGVGEAIKGALKTKLFERDELFVQTKFTYVNGQDHRLPYDPKAPLPKQVEQSFESSLEHLGVEYLDSYVLHGPSTYPGLSSEDWETWGAMEDLQRAGHARIIGISNVAFPQLEELYAKSSVKPAIVQNRTFTRPHADRAVRDFCREHDIAYQGFSLVTAIPKLLFHPALRNVEIKVGKSAVQVVFRYCLQKGIVVLTGTTSPEHMAQDLEVPRFELAAADVAALDQVLGL